MSTIDIAIPEEESQSKVSADKGGKFADARYAPSGKRATIFGTTIIILALISGTFSFLVLAGLTPINPVHNVVVTALAINAIFVFILLGLVGWEVGRLIIARKRGSAGARIHARIVTLFALVASVPAILVAIIASVTLDRGLDRWFSARNQQIIENSVTVAQAYIQERARILSSDILSTANDLNKVVASIEANKDNFDRFVRTQARIRHINGLYVIKKDYSIITKIVLEQGRNYSVPPQSAFERADKGETVIILPNHTDELSVLIKLPDSEDLYVFGVRDVDNTIMQHLRSTRATLQEFSSLEARRFGVQLAFGQLYLELALILLLSAVWLGLWFANRLVMPIRRLIGAAKLVSEGNLDVRVPVKLSEGDLANLGATFNTMTGTLQQQRDDLLLTNTKLDQRNEFTEAVLEGVTAGIVGLDKNLAITIANKQAENIFGFSAKDSMGASITDIVPELSEIFDELSGKFVRQHQSQISLKRGNEERVITIRIASEGTDEDSHGFVLTLDDITELINAQRTSAWSDVARRIAHEIKNPLTPIQLSAERLQRKYGRHIEQDPHIFEQCTNTIIRQVGDIGKMVDEFSSFARMPKATLARNDLSEIVRQSVFLMQSGNPDVEITSNIADEKMLADCDHRLISQALTNLIKNATEAIESAPYDSDEVRKIDVKLHCENDSVQISVSDNGIGLPADQRHRLLEPYVTTREKGTGLGLAIVRRIMEEHNGTVYLQEGPFTANDGRRGAQAVLDFPKFQVKQDNEYGN